MNLPNRKKKSLKFFKVLYAGKTEVILTSKNNIMNIFIL